MIRLVTSPPAFLPRVTRALSIAGMTGEKAPKNILRFPNVTKMFFLATPYALGVLDSDPSLLARLDAHLKVNPELSETLCRDLIEGKKLYVTRMGPPQLCIGYTLSGTTDIEMAALARMGQEFSSNPDFEETAVLVERIFGISLRSSMDLDREGVQVLNQIFDPKSEALGLMMARNITDVVIIDNKEYVSVIPEHGRVTLFISFRALRFGPGYIKAVLS